jgi:hypothetical protein
MRRVSLSVAATATMFLLSSGAQAVVLTPGVVTPLPGTTVAANPSLAGTIVQDILTPFTMTTTTGTVTGEVQSRVVHAVDGTYDFYWRVFNDSTSAGDIGFLRTGDISTPTYDANYRIDGLGDLAPVSALLFTSPTPGFINFAFYDTTSSNPTALAPGQSSLFIFLDTDATHYAKTAFVDVASIGTFFDSNEIATFAPSAVPELSTWAMMLAGFAGLGFAGYRTSRKSAEIAA